MGSFPGMYNDQTFLLHRVFFFFHLVFFVLFEGGLGVLGWWGSEGCFFFHTPSTFSAPIDYRLTYAPDCNIFLNLNIVVGIFCPTKVLHFFNAPTDFASEKVNEVWLIIKIYLRLTLVSVLMNSEIAIDWY